MKKILCLLCLIMFAAPTFATYVNGHYRKDGTYVQGHYRSNANYTRIDNYSTRGNYNPYTGQKGYTNPYKMPTNSTYKPYKSKILK